MSLRSLVALMAMLVVSLTGCVVVARNPGDVTFLWTFQGQGCAMVPAVKNVKITIPGQTLANDGVYDCSTAGTAGIVLHDFSGGVYTYTIQGRDYNGTVLYTKSGSFTVDGPITVSVDLDLAGGASAYAYLGWRFPANSQFSNPTCDQAGVANVLVSIDGSDWATYKCSDGWMTSGVSSIYLTPGSHTATFSAVNAMNFEYYSGQVTISASTSPTYQEFTLAWAVGGIAIAWQLSDGVSTQTCAQAGVTDVYVNFKDAQMNFLYTGAGDKESCGPGTVVYSYIKPGTYDVYVQATGAAGTYSSNQATPPRVTVSAGVFPQTASSTIVVTRQ